MFSELSPTLSQKKAGDMDHSIQSVMTDMESVQIADEQN
jgi:hypothetical protein